MAVCHKANHSCQPTLKHISKASVPRPMSSMTILIYKGQKKKNTSVQLLLLKYQFQIPAQFLYILMPHQCLVVIVRRQFCQPFCPDNGQFLHKNLCRC